MRSQPLLQVRTTAATSKAVDRLLVYAETARKSRALSPHLAAIRRSTMGRKKTAVLIATVFCGRLAGALLRTGHLSRHHADWSTHSNFNQCLCVFASRLARVRYRDGLVHLSRPAQSLLRLGPHSGAGAAVCRGAARAPRAGEGGARVCGRERACSTECVPFSYCSSHI